ncbi:MAG: hypothetical protein IAF58_09975 [Leptolyngbya sp.]|nr:hypothetical protein [Candidatus Melainabacteria bacterium]
MHSKSKKVFATSCALLACFFQITIPAFAHSELVSFPGQMTPLAYRSPTISYNLNGANERFLVYVPDNYSNTGQFGLIVFNSPIDTIRGVPDGWEDVLHSQKFLLVAPENAGNGQSTERRAGLGVLAAKAMIAKYNIDKSRIYAAGLSGGARIASILGFCQGDIFRGTIQSCGTNFIKPIVWRLANPESASDKQYGQARATAQEIDYAKRYVRFALITGSNDFRYNYIRDIYNNGFVPERFQCKLFDIPNMQHINCDGDALRQALEFLRGR